MSQKIIPKSKAKVKKSPGNKEPIDSKDVARDRITTATNHINDYLVKVLTPSETIAVLGMSLQMHQAAYLKDLATSLESKK